MKAITMSPCRHRVRGASLVELLAASLILCVGVLGLVQLWSFSFQSTVRTDNNAIAYNIGRRALETAKQEGFWLLSEGTSDLYVTDSQAVTTESDAHFRATTTVTSTPSWPNNRSVRAVRVDVVHLQSGQTLYRTDTMLVRSGI